jgi:hypothetical protein
MTFLTALRHGSILAACCLVIACRGSDSTRPSDSPPTSGNPPASGVGSGNPVTPVNMAPQISGSAPTSVTVGQPYSFQPAASDPEGQTLSFLVSNRPAWATFNSNTGQLSGTPSSSHVGTYRDIQITVSDGTNVTSLPAFSIAVAAATIGAATLRWVAPTANEDGTPIENLSGYRIYYGTSTGNLSSVMEIRNPTVTTAVIDNLSPGTWYFGLKAFNALNVESSFSNIASKTIS